MNVITVDGNLTRDPELRTTAGGNQVLVGTIANNERRKNSQTGEWEDYPSFFSFNIWGNRGESLAKFVHKGDKLVLQGKMKQERWEKDGQKHSRDVINVAEVTLMSRKREADAGTEDIPQPEYTTAIPEIYDEDIPF